MITTTEKVRGERILNNMTMSKKKKEQIEGTFFFWRNLFLMFY